MIFLKGACKSISSNVPQFIRKFSTSQKIYQSYSHVIVGAGSAGCVLANRLSENSSNKVLLLEAGPKDTLLGSRLLQWKIHMPAALMYNLCDDKYNWYYETESQKYCNNRKMYWPRGRVWGGSSSLNAMVYIRGHAKDYDRWEKEGAASWNYQNCLPYFKKAQTHELGGDAYRGDKGPLNVSRGTSGNLLHDVFLEATKQAGYPLTNDVNGYQQEGFGLFDMTMHNGFRWSAATAYLRPALNRSLKNIEVKSKVLTTKVLVDGKRAVGVEYIQDGDIKKVYAENEVILSGGSINSPQLLMLSGIGDARHLKQLNIPVVQNLPGVGQNLQDHLELYVVQKCKKPVTLLNDQKGLRMIKVGLQWFINQTGAAATSHLESGGFARSRPGIEHPDIMFHFLPSQVIDNGRTAPYMEAFQLHAGPMRPESKGSITLRSTDPRMHPIINPNYLSTEMDRWEMRESIKLSREIFGQKAFDEFRDGETEPTSKCTDEQLDMFISQHAESAYHPSCTCKMGDPNKDEMAVVDPTTKVIGMEHLRVVDASIMPSIASGNLNAPTIMIAERASDLIQGNTMLTSNNVPVYVPQTLANRR